MKQQTIRCITLLVALLLCVTGILSQAQAQSYGVIYTAENPVPAIAERVRPAVVQVISMARTWTREYGIQNQEIGYGSGVYIDERGYIVTNYHVISDAETVEIVTLSGERLPVAEISYDDSTDLALLRLEAPLEGVQPVPMGDSDQLVIGELAIVIGNPGASDNVFFGTVTVGVISGLERIGVNAGHFSRTVNTIQVDAALHSGTSGGAMLNANGELMGIPTLKIGSSYSGSYEGLGFCIPVNTVKDIISDLIQYGKVQRPRMGILITELEGPDEPIPGYPPAGLLVNEIEENTPAASSGLKAYDVITHANGIRVTSFTELSDITDLMKAGDILHLTVYRCYNPLINDWLDNPETLEFDIELQMLDD